MSILSKFKSLFQVKDSFQVVGRADQVPFSGDFLFASHQKLTKAHAVFDDSKAGNNSRLSLG